MSDAALAPAEAAAAAEALWDRVAAVVDGALATGDPVTWHRPTPCPAWDVHDLVAHVTGATSRFAGLDQPAIPEGWAPPAGMSALDAQMERDVAARRDWSPGRLREELDRAARAQVEGLAALDDLTGDAVGPLGPTDQRDLFAVRMFDLWHHLWDLSTALGVPADLADGSRAAVECHTYVAARIPWLHSRQAAAPEGAAVRVVLGDPLRWDRTAVVVDGRGRWGDVPAEDVLEAPAAVFSLLMTGRLDEGAAAAAGLVTTGGEASRLATARMFS
ncbi:maleylpyruvate isomerase family mycothiol-dependent enzyme [Euzebya sp.]|uniref:maleylpyruvate isomerase family mycothiol-dependent enzyme n=1 Tax=Euzebya sp. TaxID=1971409 RepID=UPI00351910CF